MTYRALACDYDGTLATDGVVPVATVAALTRLGAAGVRLVLVTGRELSDLKRTFSPLELFALVVAENGAVVHDPARGSIELCGAPPSAALIAALERRGVPFVAGRVVIASREPHQLAMAAVVRELGLQQRLVLNKGNVMLLPAGVDKASGLRVALGRLGISPAECVGVGDAENDLALFEACGYAVAVDNALAPVKRAAAWVTRSARGAGVEELVERWLSFDLSGPGAT